MLQNKPLVEISKSFAEPNMKAPLLGHRAIQTFDVYKVLIQTRPMYVEEICCKMFESLEFVIKGIVLKVDNTFEPKAYNHRILEIIKKYKEKIVLFREISSNNGICDFLQKIESKRYIDTRFGEMAIHLDLSKDLYENLFLRMISFLHEITGVRFFMYKELCAN